MEEKQKADQPNLSELITFTEATRISGFSDRHLRTLASKHLLWAVKLGRNWFTTTQAVQAYLSKERKRGRKPKKAEE